MAVWHFAGVFQFVQNILLYAELPFASAQGRSGLESSMVIRAAAELQAVFVRQVNTEPLILGGVFAVVGFQGGKPHGDETAEQGFRLLRRGVVQAWVGPARGGSGGGQQPYGLFRFHKLAGNIGQSVHPQVFPEGLLQIGCNTHAAKGFGDMRPAGDAPVRQIAKLRAGHGQTKAGQFVQNEPVADGSGMADGGQRVFQRSQQRRVGRQPEPQNVDFSERGSGTDFAAADQFKAGFGRLRLRFLQAAQRVVIRDGQGCQTQGRRLAHHFRRTVRSVGSRGMRVQIHKFFVHACRVGRGIVLVNKAGRRPRRVFDTNSLSIESKLV